MGAAAVTADRRLVRVALLAFLTFTVPHLVFHASHTEQLTLGWAGWLIASLAVEALIPLALLVLAWRAPDDRTAVVTRPGHPGRAG